MPEFFKSLDTKSVRAGEPSPRVGGAIVTPIFQTAMFERGDETGYDAIPYIRLNNTPNQIAVAAKLRSLENAEAAVVTASGMAAISTALLTFLSAGDHLLVQDCLYGGTHYLVTDDFAAFERNLQVLVDIYETGSQLDLLDWQAKRHLDGFWTHPHGNLAPFDKKMIILTKNEAPHLL